MEEKHASADDQSGSCWRVDVARSPSVLPFPAPTSAGFQPPSHPHATGQFSKTWSQSCHSVEPYIISQWQRMKCKTAPGVNLFSCKPFSWTLCPLACTGYAPITLVGNSLKVQWLELCILAGELKSHKPCFVAEKTNKQTNNHIHAFTTVPATLGELPLHHLVYAPHPQRCRSNITFCMKLSLFSWPAASWSLLWAPGARCFSAQKLNCIPVCSR